MKVEKWPPGCPNCNGWGYLGVYPGEPCKSCNGSGFCLDAAHAEATGELRREVEGG